MFSPLRKRKMLLSLLHNFEYNQIFCVLVLIWVAILFLKIKSLELKVQNGTLARVQYTKTVSKTMFSPISKRSILISPLHTFDCNHHYLKLGYAFCFSNFRA